MQCPVCGLEIEDNNNAVCPNCRASLKRVQILSSEERENFRGTTIEVETSGSKRDSGTKSEFGSAGYGKEHTPFPRFRIFPSILAGIFGMLFLASIILFLTVIISPLGIFILAILVFTWFLRRFRF